MNTIIDDAVDRAEPEDYDLSWDCDHCEAETPHDIVDQNESPEGIGYIVDTTISCNECGHEHDVTVSVSDDPC